MQKNTPVLIHVPHSSICIPPEEEEFFVVDLGKLQHEMVVMTDHYCDELFNTGDEMIRFPVSRLICDPERFRDDGDEIMAAVGMGAIYKKCSDGTELKRITSEHREELLKMYYDEHHKQLEAAVERKLEEFGECIIVDGHSFYEEPLPYELDQDKDRPDICIGTDNFHTPECIKEGLVSYFGQEGYRVEVNKPFAGTMVPLRFFGSDSRVKSVMIEINRRLYLDRSCNRTNGFACLKKAISRAIENCCNMGTDSNTARTMKYEEFEKKYPIGTQEHVNAIKNMPYEEFHAIVSSCPGMFHRQYLSQIWKTNNKKN